MKRFNWLLIGSVILSLAMVLLVGCGVSKSEYEALQAEHATLLEENTSLEVELEGVQSDLVGMQANLAGVQADYDELNANYVSTKNELAEIKEVYPPKDFSSLSELQDWLVENEVSERAPTTFAENWYSKALEIQEDALKDGYIISVDLDYAPEAELFYVACVTIINGDIWYWDPETDEPTQYYGFGKVK